MGRLKYRVIYMLFLLAIIACTGCGGTTEVEKIPEMTITGGDGMPCQTPEEWAKYFEENMIKDITFDTGEGFYSDRSIQKDLEKEDVLKYEMKDIYGNRITSKGDTIISEEWKYAGDLAMHKYTTETVKPDYSIKKIEHSNNFFRGTHTSISYDRLRNGYIAGDYLLEVKRSDEYEGYCDVSVITISDTVGIWYARNMTIETAQEIFTFIQL